VSLDTEGGTIEIDGSLYTPSKFFTPLPGGRTFDGLYGMYMGDFPLLDNSPIVDRVGIVIGPTFKKMVTESYIPFDLVENLGYLVGTENVPDFVLSYMANIPLTIYINTNYVR
jgi:hypothetical protein